MSQFPIIIGFTGSIGSGCSTTIEVMKEHLKNKCKVLSLSDNLRKLIEKSEWKEKLDKASKEERRNLMQSAGNYFRQEKGKEILAEMTVREIKKIKKADWEKLDFIIVDSIRNIGEIGELRKNFQTYICAIYASYPVRRDRMEKIYNYQMHLFKRDDERDHSEEGCCGQQVDACVDDADIMIKNEENISSSKSKRNEYFNKKIEPHLNLILNPKSRNPDIKEVYITMAYSMAAQSRCLQRKVGTLIATEDFQIVSLGHNDVPKNQESCKSKYGGCNRTITKSKLLKMYEHCPTCGTKLNDDKICEKCEKSVEEIFLTGKNLGICRALHAEENAIVNAAKAGLPLRNGVIFTTTFPCNLCANKIVNVGLKKVVYVEPYPSKETIETLESGKVEVELFEGVKSRAFFDLFKRIGEMERMKLTEVK